MGFLAPWFLAGMAAVGLPLWLHLLRRYRSTPHPFSSLMFFERRTQSSVKHRRLRYLLLLSLRLALLIALAIAFANPFVNRTILAGSGRHALVVAVDNSFSMRYSNHLARAKAEALKVLGQVRPGDQAQVLSLGSKVHFLTQPTDDSAQLRASVESIQPSDERSSFAELARVLRTMSQASRLPLEIHFASDLQKSSMPPAFADLRLPAGSTLVFHAIGGDRAPNFLVESVTAPARIYDPKKVRVQAVLTGIENEPARRTVSLVVDNKVLESKRVDIPAGGRTQVEFLSLESSYGFHRGEVRIEPADSLPQDDHFYFAVERADPHRVLFLHESGNARALLYYRTALEAASEAGFAIDPLAVDQAANQSLSKYAFVVLSDVATLPSGLEENLRNYAANGGSLLISLGPSAAARQQVPVSHQAIQESRYFSRDADRFQLAGQVDPEHPAINKANKLEGVQFYQAVRVDPGKSRVIARLTDQTPLLMETNIGEGRVLVFASTFDNVSNDFPLHASFLPFVEQTARYLGGQQERSPNLAVDSFTDLRAAREQGKSVEVIDPTGARPLSLKEAATIQSFQLTREGFYEIHRANGRQELMAVHADRRESDLAPIPAEVLQLWRNTGTPAGPDTNTTDADKHERSWGLWRYALFIVLLIAITESLIGSRYLSREEKETA
jgi:hypothetical protein